MLHFDVMYTSLPFILEGILVTLKFTAFSLLGGLPLGVVLALCKISNNKFLKLFADFYTSIFRGTPLIVQLSIIYFGLPVITGVNMGTFEAGVLTFALNSAAYVSEHIGAGLMSVDKGQWETSQVLGLTYMQAFRHVILPQAIRTTLPSLINEWINLIKESALVSIIGEADLFKRAMMVASEKYLYFEPYLTVALCYYVMVMTLTIIAARVQKRLAYA